MALTIKDIARESGYAVGTVSRVLNNHPDVSDKARAKILEVVEKHHFKLNSNAKHLKQQASNGIAIIVKGNQNMLFASIVEQMQGMIREKGYACLMYYIGEMENELEQALQVIIERRPMGILFLGSNLEYFKERFEIIHTHLYEKGDYSEMWRLFDMDYTGNLNDFPGDSSLRRAYKQYLLDGGQVGEGYGVFFW